MPEAVIVARWSGRRRRDEGVAEERPRRRPRGDSVARSLVERNPEVDFAQTDDIMMGCGFRRASRATTSAATRSSSRASTIMSRRSRSAVFARLRCRRSGWRFTRSRRARAIRWPIAAGVECASARRGARRSRCDEFADRWLGRRGLTTSTSRWASRRRTWPSVARCRESPKRSVGGVVQQRGCAARESGHFDREIVGVEISETHDVGGDVIAAHTVRARRWVAAGHDGWRSSRQSCRRSSPMAR